MFEKKIVNNRESFSSQKSENTKIRMAHQTPGVLLKL